MKQDYYIQQLGDEVKSEFPGLFDEVKPKKSKLSSAIKKANLKKMDSVARQDYESAATYRLIERYFISQLPETKPKFIKDVKVGKKFMWGNNVSGAEKYLMTNLHMKLGVIDMVLIVSETGIAEWIDVNEELLKS